MTESYDGDEPMYSNDNDSSGDNGSGEDGCADFGCLLLIIMIAYALFKCCNSIK